MRYKDYLQSRPRYDVRTSFDILGVKFEDVMNLPIHYLNLNGQAKTLLVDSSIRKDSTTTFKIRTIGQLVNMGFDDVEYYLMNKASKNYEQVIYAVEVALARFSLKLFDSSFSVDDISIYDMNLSDQVRGYLKKANVAELGQLRENGAYYLSKMKVGQDKKSVIESIKSAMAEFGTKLRLPSSEKHAKENKHENADAPKKIPPIFPRILESLNAEKQLAEEAAKAQPTEPSTDGQTQATGRRFVEVDYTGKKYDYTKLMNLAFAQFKNKLQFTTATKITNLTLNEILRGERISRRCLERLATYFGCKPRDLVVVHTEQATYKTPKQNEPNVDYSKLRTLLEKHIMSVSQLSNILKVPYHAINEPLRLGRHMNPEVLQSIANYFGCDTRDLMTENISKGEVFKRANMKKRVRKPEYDYSRLIDAVYQKYHIGIEEFGRKINLTKCQIYRLGLQLGLDRVSQDKISRNLGVDFGTLVKPLAPQPAAKAAAKPVTKPEPSKNHVLDFSPLLKLIDTKYEYYSDFLRDVQLSPGTMSRILRGDKINVPSLIKIMKFFDCELDDIVHIENTSVRQRLDSSIKKLMSSPDPTSDEYVDYSKLYKLMEEKHITFTDIVKGTNITYSIISQIKNNKPIYDRKMKVLCEFLGCQPADVLDIEKVVAKAHTFDGAICDYSGLYKLLKSKSLPLYELLKQLNLHPYIQSVISKGMPIKPDILNQICGALQCKPDDIVVVDQEKLKAFNEQKYQNRSKAKKKVKPVHSEKLLGLAAQPSAAENAEASSTEAEALTQTQTEAIDQGVAGKGQGNPDSKFYMTPSGYVNPEIGRVKKFIQRPTLTHSPFEKEL